MTLWSLSTQDFDGMNNLLQIPFALPWLLLPFFHGTSSVAFAWIAAGCGAFNAALIHFWGRREADLADAKRRLSEGQSGWSDDRA